MRFALVSLGLLAACGPSEDESACKDDLLVGDLVITEVFPDYKPAPGGSGEDTGKEWIEIYNATDRPVDLEGVTVVHSKVDDTDPDTHAVTSITIAPGQFFTLGNATSDLLPAYVDYGYAADLGALSNTSGKIALRCGETEIDSAIYDTIKSGKSRQLTSSQPPDYTLNDDQVNWCEAADTEFEAGNFGTPGSDNDCTPVIIGQCNDNGTMRDTVPPAPGDLVITEVMPKPSAVSATVGQWFEVVATKDVDLNSIGLDRASDTAGPTILESNDCVRLITGSYAVFARSGDSSMNGGLTTLGTFPFSINPSGVPGDVQVTYEGTVIDAVTWPASATGKSRSLDPDFINSTANDDPTNSCDGSTVYNTVDGDMDYGSPGTANPECIALPQPGQCLDNGTPRAIVKPAPGQLVITEFLANPALTGTDATQEWFEITNTGATAFDLNGLSLKGNATTVDEIESAVCKTVAPAGFALFAHGTEPTGNGMLPAVDATFRFALAQSNGSIHVLDGATPIDSITWTTGIGDGVSKQLKPENTNISDNDVPANFCDAKPAQMYGSAANFGTPKAINVCLP